MEFKINVVFKQEYSKLVALYTHRYGFDKLEMIEDAIQDTFYKALRLWPGNPPENPKGWLRTVTRNHIIDRLREKTKLSNQAVMPDQQQVGGQWDDPKEIRDNQLKMIFACCHPRLKPTDQLLLSLKFLCGFGVNQISRVLYKSPAAVEKAVSRARHKFKSLIQDLEVPQVDALSDRLDGVLKVIYLQFTEGYKVSEGDHLVDHTLCLDAIRLAELLTTYRELEHPKLYALLSLMCFQASRLEARVNDQGIVTLENQDRRKWNYGLILQGVIYLGRSMAVDTLSSYHIEGAIASYHCTSADYQSTNWQAIIEWYDLGLTMGDNPNYQLNRLIAYRQINSAKDTLAETDQDKLPSNQFTQVFLGDLYLDSGQSARASKHYRKALAHKLSQPEESFIKTKLNQANSMTRLPSTEP